LIENSSYTVDAIALLCYLADKLPRSADKIFKRAEDEEAILVEQYLESRFQWRRWQRS
jgi:hypothetical protein